MAARSVLCCTSSSKFQRITSCHCLVHGSGVPYHGSLRTACCKRQMLQQARSRIWCGVSVVSQWPKFVLQGANRKASTKLSSKGSLSPAPSWPGLQQMGLLHKSGGQRSDGSMPDQPSHGELLHPSSCPLIQPQPSCAHLRLPAGFMLATQTRNIIAGGTVAADHDKPESEPSSKRSSKQRPKRDPSTRAEPTSPLANQAANTASARLSASPLCATVAPHLSVDMEGSASSGRENRSPHRSPRRRRQNQPSWARRTLEADKDNQ